MYQKSRAWIELNMNHLAHNVKELSGLLPEGGALMPVVKANAYGHGAILIAKNLQKLNISNFAVASLPEAAALREAGIEGQILILGYTHPKDFPMLSRYNLTQTVVDSFYAQMLNSFGKPVKVHISIDTGMRRLGERSENEAAILSVWQNKNLIITGVFSHLCVSDSLETSDVAFTLKQFDRFRQVVAFLHENGISGFSTHMQGSYGLLNYPEFHFDFARVGIALYGCLSNFSDSIKAQVCFKPVLTLKSRIQSIRLLLPGEAAGYGLTYRTREAQTIAAVSIGYADGFPRNLSGKGHVLVHDCKAPIIGRICMDQLLINISDIPHVLPGDEVILIGHSQNETITAEEMADLSGTISNEFLSRLGQRLERIELID